MRAIYQLTQRELFPCVLNIIVIFKFHSYSIYYFSENKTFE